MPPAPVPRLDGAATQIDNLLYVFVGYGTIDICRPPTSRTFVLDTMTKRWDDIPSLPTLRYTRLHIHFAAKISHWSVAVKDGKVLEKNWRSEVPIPRGRPHRL
ncbi:hypothetical protein MLD38_034586 [Melastoma candidum]|uniref:Uncharacterized protein n=1 Tax=Melastoma candidum TaxID=119954 RepID=A0ACB9MCP2_9MYRT|nr:hypothetical protein MLD38_034586 [Melastoma candidum]